MKYRQLTKEQFESLHKEFAQFLATQSIDVKEWNEIKKGKPNLAIQEMNIFSDIVWALVLITLEVPRLGPPNSTAELISAARIVSFSISFVVIPLPLIVIAIRYS